jgi:hypothetical protein
VTIPGSHDPMRYFEEEYLNFSSSINQLDYLVDETFSSFSSIKDISSQLLFSLSSLKSAIEKKDYESIDSLSMQISKICTDYISLINTFSSFSKSLSSHFYSSYE